MRNILLIIACILEITFGIYCIASKSNRTIAGYLCAVFALVLLIFTIWLLLFPRYELPKPKGQYAVETASGYYVDKNRIETYLTQNQNRALQVGFWYPKNIENDKVGECPLIIFSHGSYGVKESNVSLYNELASYGYVVCSIDHTYQCFSTTDANGKKIPMDKGYRKETMEQDTSNKEQSYEYFQKWMKIRTGDINFVLDTIIQTTSQSNCDELYRLIDVNKIGLIGHSLGGSSVLGVGRSRNDISAVVSLEAPFMCDIIGVKDNEFVWNKEPYPIPVLNVYSDSSWKHLNEWEQYAENAELLSSPQKTAHNIYLKGTGHMSLTDLTFSCPMLCMLFGENIFLNKNKNVDTLNRSCLDFFDYYLKGQGKGIPSKTEISSQ